MKVPRAAALAVAATSGGCAFCTTSLLRPSEAAVRPSPASARHQIAHRNRALVRPRPRSSALRSEPEASTSADDAIDDAVLTGGGDMGSVISGGEEDRIRINNFISYLCNLPQSAWSPDVLESHTPDLLRDGSAVYKQTMALRASRARDGDERAKLERVEAFLNGYLQQQRRRNSRVRVQEILGAAAVGPQELDAAMAELSASKGIDSDLVEYVTGLVEAEEMKRMDTDGSSRLLAVLRAVRDRLQAELRTGSRPEIRILAYALRLPTALQRSDYLRSAFTKLEDLEEFLDFVTEGVGYFENGGIDVRSNMPQDNLDKMKDIQREAERMREFYLG
eukprot:TRINITY_DN9343_c0_g1_i1.p1 TRINITY_DN9343_c0_g1~~TRINITY_DN9343_c0_g1_i1.p1  ORF type:complete len:352 (-),score=89.30 TRINITY_DN9343_c0_g1_i1:447-1451(-)